MTFNELIKNKQLIYIPIYSMFSHETGKIDLCCDGNVNRWLSAFYNAKQNWKSLKVFLPSQKNCKDWIEKESYSKNFEKFFNIFLGLGSVCSKDEPIPENMNGIIYYEESDEIKINAGYQRGKEFGQNIINKIISEKSDLVIIEGQGTLELLIENRKNNNFNSKLVYWCPVCATNTKTRSFLSKDKELNEKLFKEVDYIIVAAEDQLTYLKELNIDQDKIIYHPTLIDRSTNLFKYEVNKELIEKFKNKGKVIYLPFRLSDEGYKIWDIIDSLTNFNYEVYTPNMNDTSINELKKICNKFSNSLSDKRIEEFFENLNYISSDRSTYYSLIDNCENIIIPYFEDYSFVMHAAVDELIRDKNIKACVFTSKNDFINYLKS